MFLGASGKMLPSIDEFNQWLAECHAKAEALSPDSPELPAFAEAFRRADDFIAYIHSTPDVHSQLSYLRFKMSEIMGTAITQLNHALVEQAVPFHEQATYETTVIVCDHCKKDRSVIVVPIANKPVKANYVCTHCNFSGIITLTVSEAAAIRAKSKLVELEPKKKKKKSEPVERTMEL